MRFRITVRGDDIELRGYIDGEVELRRFAAALADEFGTNPMIAYSPADDDYNPFTDWAH